MCIEGKEKNIREIAEKLYVKRYFGEDDYLPMWNSSLNPKWSEDKEENDFINNFGYQHPIKENIMFNPFVLDELKEIANEKNVNISILINCYILQMLERDRRTVKHTKGKKVYIKNNLYCRSFFICQAETRDEFIKNVFDNNFIKYGQIEYDNEEIELVHEMNERIYIINYLLNVGYSMEQINNIEREEKEYLKDNSIFITFKVDEIDKSYDVPIHISTRLGLHYILFNTTNLSNYERIEIFLNNKLKGDKKIWDLYQDYLNQKLI